VRNSKEMVIFCSSFSFGSIIECKQEDDGIDEDEEDDKEEAENGLKILNFNECFVKLGNEKLLLEDDTKVENWFL
jgi:hypothetical protein